MTTTIPLLGTFVLFALWQSTFWLAAAWVLGKRYRYAPWKAHWLYATGIFAAILTPLLSTLVFATGNGMLQISVIPQWINLHTLGIFCLAGMLFFLAILLYGIAHSRKLMFHATPYPDRELQDALLRHSKMLRNVSLPILFTSPSVKSPTVWCWGLHPAVLLPESLAEKLDNTERDAVFLHELSHIIRRDHLTALFTRLCGALLFWHPLYWFVLWQCDFAADEACDYVVLAQGNIPPEQYTDTLLRLVAGERLLPILQPFSRKEKIMRRIEQIQSPLRKHGSHASSQAWTASVFSTALLVSITLAFCQGQPQSRISGGNDGDSRLPAGTITAARSILEIRGHTNDVSSVAFSPDGRRIVTSSSDRTARIWDAESGRELQTLSGHTDDVNFAAFSPDGRHIVTSSSDRTARIWDAESGRELRRLQGHRDTVESAVFSPNGRRIVTGSEDNTIRIWDAESGRALQTLQGHRDDVNSVAFSQDGRRIVSSSSDRTVRIWDAESGRELRTLRGHTDSVESAVFSPNGRRIVTASEDNTARIWDAESGGELQALRGHGDDVSSAAFSPDGRFVVTCGDDGTVRIWEAESGGELLVLREHRDDVHSAIFSPDGGKIVTGGEDRVVRIWALE
ncbi:MAG: hypothetical protein FWG73_01785 [Planctomycetaceae bacterium]|nr:hypothetical protein [Planctomycetaceae bacterium]